MNIIEGETGASVIEAEDVETEDIESEAVTVHSKSYSAIVDITRNGALSVSAHFG
jgi:hypothetical protein